MMQAVTVAVVAEPNGEFVLGTAELEEPRGHEVLVRVVAVGVCHTDLVARTGNYLIPLPAVLGHEGSGIVEAVGEQVTKVAPGDHVVMTFNSCGRCTNCRTGRDPYCQSLPALNVTGGRPDGSRALSRDGAPLHGHFFGQSSFGTYALASERNVVAVPADLPLDVLGPLGCGIQTGAGAILNSLRSQPGDAVAIFGAGSVGLSAVMAARLAGCDPIIAVDLQPRRRELAQELGATHTIDGASTDIASELWSITTTGLDGAVDFTSNQGVINAALYGLHSRGTLLLGGSAPLGTQLQIDMSAVHLGRTMRGVIEGDSVPDLFIPQLLKHYRAGRFPFDRLITRYPFDQINAAVDAMHDGDVVKPVLVMPEAT
ncbi:NAD(P)-dependent alcohol dehydrogenase [Mycobacterium simiae]|uniref:NAD(P)-dependent alcohol dehydrogenase n=1 Tax=Mycobacterium simiae TaxID=1784 RepID=UPI0033ABD4BD